MPYWAFSRDSEGFHFPVQDIDHGGIGAHVAVVEVAAHGVLDGARRGADVAVIEVNEIAVDGEGGADLRPVVFVGGDVFGGAATDRGGSGGDGAGTQGELEKIATMHEKRPPDCRFSDAIAVNGSGARGGRRQPPARNRER